MEEIVGIIIKTLNLICRIKFLKTIIRFKDDLGLGVAD